MKTSPSKKLRDRLFRKSAPLIRPYADSDFWVIWAAYDLGSFAQMNKGAKKEELRQFMEAVKQANDSVLVIEDDCKWFKEKRGPVALVTAKTDGWKFQPRIDFFMWASTRMKLRAMVAAFKAVRYSKDIGVCVVTATENSKKLADRVMRYGVLFFIGRIPGGNIKGDEFVYSIRGLKDNHGTS